MSVEFSDRVLHNKRPFLGASVTPPTTTKNSNQFSNSILVYYITTKEKNDTENKPIFKHKKKAIQHLCMTFYKAY